MSRIPTYRAVAVVAGAALLASLVITAAAAPTTAAKPKCAGKTATIVGTNKADRIIGTRKRDVIVAKGGADKVFGRGGNDLICGGPGNDRLVGQGGIDKLIGGAGADKLYGGPGPDRLFAGPGPDLAAGQLGNDVIDGGLGVDTCYQNTGSGPVARCEKPVVVAPEPRTPPDTGPQLHSLDGIFAVAYSDVDGLDGYSTGDVLIAKLVDNGDGTPGPGDTVQMGGFPKDLGATDFGDWGVESHSLSGPPNCSSSTSCLISTPSGLIAFADNSSFERYREASSEESQFVDAITTGHLDQLETHAGSPSKPSGPNLDPPSITRTSDDDFIDVVINP